MCKYPFGEVVRVFDVHDKLCNRKFFYEVLVTWECFKVKGKDFDIDINMKLVVMCIGKMRSKSKNDRYLQLWAND